jgi:Rad/Gem-related GTP binding protein 1
MGSSTTSTSSNNTINTSTDSANTVATLITVTDGETDTDTDRKPMNHMNEIIGTSLSLDKDDEFLSGSSTDDSNPIPPPPTPLLGAVSKEQHFIFVRTECDDEGHRGNLDDETRKISLLRSSIHNNRNIKAGVSTTTTTTKSPRSSRHRHHRQKPDSRTKNTSHINGHPPPPDLHFDFFSDTFPQPSFNSTAQGRVFDDIRQHSVMTDTATADKARGDTNIASGTVVLATASSSSTTTVLVKTAGVLQGTVIPAVGDGGGVLDQTATSSGVTATVGKGTGINIPPSPPKVNTTTNPLGIAGATALPARQTAATTIVVQQPSLSGGSPTIATVLLKNCGAGGSGGAGVSGVGVGQTGEPSGTSAVSKKQREENMKQLLDVANTLTLQELHDFEMR